MIDALRIAIVAFVSGLVDRWDDYERHVNAVIDSAIRDYRRENRRLRARTRGERFGRLKRVAGQNGNLVDVVLTITIAGVIGYVGLQIGSDTEDSAGFETQGVDRGNQTRFENASEDITTGFETAFGLLDVVFIALMLSVIIVALVGLRR